MFESHYGIEKMAAERSKSLRSERVLNNKNKQVRARFNIMLLSSLILITVFMAIPIAFKGI